MGSGYLTWGSGILGRVVLGGKVVIKGESVRETTLDCEL